MVSLDRFIKRFNTQPPEGGCSVIVYSLNFGCGFQHTAARRRLLNGTDASRFLEILFQHTAARRRLLINGSTNPAFMAGFNTQPPEGGCENCLRISRHRKMFQHTAARRRLLFTDKIYTTKVKFQHTAARRRLLGKSDLQNPFTWFQHTAARRRLLDHFANDAVELIVSTHSRPKAAAF